MPIDRAPFHSLVDDDGSNTTGSLWNKAAIQYALLDPMDAALATAAVTLATGSGLNTATGVTSLASVVMPALLSTDSVRVIVSFSQGSGTTTQLSLDAQGVGFIMRLDDLNGTSLLPGNVGTWDLLLRPELTNATAIRTLGSGGVLPSGASSIATPGTRMTHVQLAGISWQTGGWTLSLDSFGQTAGGSQIWAWTVLKF